MKANELRIGNYVVVNGKMEVVRDVSRHRTIVNDGRLFDFINHEIEPILLNEDWLKSFGFDKTNRINVDSGISRTPVWANHSFSITIWDNGGLFYDWIGGNIQVNYVHQLQNLYFALTGEELKL